MNYALKILLPLLLFSCTKRQEERRVYEYVPKILLTTTPVKDQGKMEACWIYAYLACLEAEKIRHFNDSVNLSPLWLARASFVEQAHECYLTKGKTEISMRNVGPEAERLLDEYGMVQWGNYKYDDLNSGVIARDIYNKVKMCINYKSGIKRLDEKIQEALPPLSHSLTQGFYFYGMHYTPKEFAHSLQYGTGCEWLTSYTHHRYYTSFALETPDNRNHHKFLNLPLDVMLDRVILALESGHAVYWEGKMPTSGRQSNEKTDPKAERNKKINLHNLTSYAQKRQKAFENYETTDQHAMAIVGIAYPKGTDKRTSDPVFICKNSWGKEWKAQGFCYMSLHDFIINTMMVGVFF